MVWCCVHELPFLQENAAGYSLLHICTKSSKQPYLSVHLVLYNEFYTNALQIHYKCNMSIIWTKQYMLCLTVHKVAFCVVGFTQNVVVGAPALINLRMDHPSAPIIKS